MRNNLIASELEQEGNFKNQKDFYSSLAYLAMMPFHHLLSAQKIYSSIFDQSSKFGISEENSFKSKIPPAELQRLIQKAAAEQNPDSADPVILDDDVSIELLETDAFGEQIKTNWTAIFRGSSFQGSAEIYRAEMFLFKRLICEREEKLGDTFILTDKDFTKYIDYGIFERLTSDEPQLLLLNSLTSLYQFSVTLPDDTETGNETTTDDESRNNEQDSQSNHHSTGKYEKENIRSYAKSVASTSILSERIHSWKSIPVAADEEFDRISNKELSCESKTTILYKLSLGSYWRRWQQAAQIAGFDFDILEKLEDVRAIRFYELTKFLRLELYDEITRSFPNELEIEYGWFTKLMPLPTFRTKDKIERQIVDLTKLFREINYVEFFLYRTQDEKASYILTFQFSN